MKLTHLYEAKMRHGSRGRYSAGCRCDRCRAANSRYERIRIACRKAGDWNGLVDAGPARDHILALSSQGIGRRTLQKLSGITDTVIFLIKSGKKQRIRARTAKSILLARPGRAVPKFKVEVCQPCLRRGHLCVAACKVEGEQFCILCRDGQPCLYFLGTGRYSTHKFAAIQKLKKKFRGEVATA